MPVVLLLPLRLSALQRCRPLAGSFLPAYAKKGRVGYQFIYKFKGDTMRLHEF